MSITPNRQPTPDRGCQRGQSSVFVIVFLGITILSLVFLYKAGKLTSEKMELQNAADGVAYSVAILEARDLNFMAYTNRAMVANEVAIGQAVGLASWPRHWESIGYYENALCGTLLEPAGNALEIAGRAAGQAATAATLPPLIAVLKAVAKVTEQTGKEIKTQCQNIRTGTDADFIQRGKTFATDVDNKIAIPLAQLMEKANQGLSDAQALFHLGTMAYVTKTVSQVTQDNMTDNNLGDTGLSPYGLAALLGHLISFGHLAPFGTTPGERYGPDPNRQSSPFIRTHRPGSTGDSNDRIGFERFAAITAAARDEFGKGPRRYVATPDFREDIPVPLPVIPLGACPGPVLIPTCFGYLKFDISFRKGLTTPIDHRAGSELRHVNAFGAGRGDQYNWSSGDTSSGSVQYGITVTVALLYAPPPPLPKKFITLVGATGNVSLGSGGFKLGIVFDIIGFIIPININFGGGLLPGLPFGAGAAQINNNANNKIDTLESTLLLAPLPLAQVVPGLPGSDYYGHAPGGSSVWPLNKPAHGLAWTGVPPIASGGPQFTCPPATTPSPSLCQVPTVSFWMPRQEIKNDLYSGLKQYSDTTDASDLWGFEGPHIIIALQKSIGDIFSVTADAWEPTGQFKLTESTNIDTIGAIAKGEVYFKRPSDMDLFRRWDTPKTPDSDTMFEEYGSAFNPYWQARLAPLSHADRAVATAQQHGQDLETGSAFTQTITASWELDNWID